MQTHALLNEPPYPHRLVDVETAMAALGISRPSIYKMFAAGTLRSIKLGRCRRIPTTELDRVMAGRPLRNSVPKHPASPKTKPVTVKVAAVALKKARRRAR